MLRALIVVSLLLLARGVGAESLEQRLAALSPGQWLSYQVPLQPGLRAPCCFTFDDSTTRGAACRLDREGWSFGHSDSDPEPPPGSQLRVLLRRTAQGFDKARALGTHCAVEAGGAVVVEVGDVSVDASLALLRPQLDSRSDDARSNAVAAIAYHAGVAVDATLIAASAVDRHEELRREAVFWLGHARGEPGFRAVRDLLERETDEDLRRHEVFALSQSPVAAAKPELRRLARSHASSEIRGEALFWLAQEDDAETEALVRAVLAQSPSEALCEKAVFALSQLPAERAIPALRDLVEQGPSREVRKQALFWLAQVDDDAVLPVFDQLLGE